MSYCESVWMPRIAPPPRDSETIAIDLAACADWKKADDPVVLDLRGLSGITDFFVIASSISSLGVRATAEALIDRLRVQHGIHPRHVEGLSEREWVCVDAGDIVIHVFLEQTRRYFDLEGLWGDAPRLTVPDAAVRGFASAKS